MKIQTVKIYALVLGQNFPKTAKVVSLGQVNVVGKMVNTKYSSTLALYNANYYSETTALLRQKGRTLDFAMAIGVILEFAVPLLLKSHIFYY